MLIRKGFASKVIAAKFLLFSSFLFVLASGQQTHASTLVELDFTVSFDAVKGAHDCLGSGIPELDVPGTCGFYSTLDGGIPYSGLISARGTFETVDFRFFEVVSLESSSCMIGSSQCFGMLNSTQVVSRKSFVSASSAYLDFSQTNNFISTFNFDFQSGVGSHFFEDDGRPFARGGFLLSNVSVTGIPEIPLPASVWPMLLVALSLAAHARRRRKS